MLLKLECELIRRYSSFEFQHCGVIKYSNISEECAASIFRCTLKRCGCQLTSQPTKQWTDWPTTHLRTETCTKCNLTSLCLFLCMHCVDGLWHGKPYSNCNGECAYTNRLCILQRASCNCFKDLYSRWQNVLLVGRTLVGCISGVWTQSGSIM